MTRRSSLAPLARRLRRALVSRGCIVIAGCVLGATSATTVGAQPLASELTSCESPSASSPTASQRAWLCRGEDSLLEVSSTRASDADVELDDAAGGDLPDAPARRDVLTTSIDASTPLPQLYAARRRGGLDGERRALRSLAVRVPLLADRFLLELATLELERGTPECGLFDAPRQSPHREIAARAAVGRVRCLLETGARHADEELATLERTYPALPDGVALELARGHAREVGGAFDEAIAIYRRIDLLHPEEAASATARTRLEALAVDHTVPALTPRQAVERAARVVRRGTLEQAHDAIESIVSLELTGELDAERTTLRVSQLRNEGRLAEARTLEATLPTTTTSASAAVATSEHPDRALTVLGLRRAVSRTRTPEGIVETSRIVTRGISNGRLASASQVAAQGGLVAELDAIIADAATRRGLACRTRSEIAIVASGTATDRGLVTLLEPCRETRDVRGVYLLARALERAGDADEARATYLLAHDLDATSLPFYALWSETRLAALGHPFVSPEVATAPSDDAPFDDDAAARSLEMLAVEHGSAFPWLARAAAALRLRDHRVSADELAEVYHAWNAAERGAGRRAGLEAVYRGRQLAGRAQPIALSTRRARRDLDLHARAEIGRIALGVGDAGIALRFGSLDRDARPRPYEELVVAAAERHHIDPNLLFAVMRVESVYDPRVVSYAGAVGLLQIMPTTGDRIAARLGRTDFGTDDLLDPATNIEFSAWYLHSLIERFDGRVPLAIAAYNGGPHNVRRWMAAHASAMPLDAFLERIPFDQTHRYVRRVLTHYAAYRREAGLALPDLDPTLPPIHADRVAF